MQGHGTAANPAGIREWRRQRESRVIQVVAGHGASPDIPSLFFGQICQGISSPSQKAGWRLVSKHLVAQVLPARSEPPRVLPGSLCFVLAAFPADGLQGSGRYGHGQDGRQV